jgi:hypothetical protein
MNWGYASLEFGVQNRALVERVVSDFRFRLSGAKSHLESNTGIEHWNRTLKSEVWKSESQI